ncbi:MAG: hypothetical protein ACJAT7_003091 [Psychromonas sp.]|jgi:hypothetical protein|uniref:BatD family protein n=1 Tax=Psychromonas sp. TaxID=1884585 RepID=UPI0039E723A4
MQIIRSTVTTLFLSLFLIQGNCATPQLQTSVSDNAVLLGDLFVLTITLNDSDSDYQLDTRPLEKEFTVYRPSQSRNSKYINGKFSQQTQWQITLQAKRVGELTIPALKLGSLTTQAIKISVEKSSDQATETEDNKIFMENSLNKNSVYLGQQLILTTKIFISENTNELELLAPSLADATVTVYGQDKEGQTIRNGTRYKTITRQFQISAKQAGDFTVKSPLLTGNLRKIVKISEWQNSVIADPINIRGDALPIEIKAKPEDFQGEWLISDDVRLIEDPTLNQQTYHVGEPITRNITLQVASVDKAKLPEIKFNYPQSLRFYPDQDELKEGQANGLLYAVRSMRHAIIADQSGELILPEIKMGWWNSQTDKQEFAILPAQTLTILAAEKDTVSPASNNPVIPASPIDEIKPTLIVDHQALIYWQIISALLLLVIVMLIFYHLYYRRLQKSSKAQNIKKVEPLDNSYSALQVQLKKNDPALIYQALLNYAQSEFPILKSLSQLNDYISLNEQDKQQLAAEIKSLENACCTPSADWNSTQLTVLITKHLQKKSNHTANNIMDLNPSKAHK